MMIIALAAAVLAFLGAGYAMGQTARYNAGFLRGYEAGQENAKRLLEHARETKMKGSDMKQGEKIKAIYWPDGNFAVTGRNFDSNTVENEMEIFWDEGPDGNLWVGSIVKFKDGRPEERHLTNPAMLESIQLY
ncbi:MAG: hypothetical protein JEY79_18040 [Pseudodesulfovibrio sp.]|nr:hypothetical protein [Pseudodesulfovibrio sp.]